MTLRTQEEKGDVMAIDSCDHGDYVVVYEFVNIKQCPVCTMQEELEDAARQIEELKDQVE